MKRILATTLMLVIGASAALAGPELVTLGQRISGSSPLPADCGMAHSLDPTSGAIGPTTPQMDSEVEPHIAINPLDRSNMVAAWIQDRNESGGGGRSNVVAVTFDGGEQWQTVLVPGISDCTGGDRSRATDPWVDFGPDGVVYLASLSFDELDPSAMVVNVSHDGGLTWSDPTTVTASPELNQDKEQISAHPRIAGKVYMVWMERVPYGGDLVDSTMFSKTTDHGVTWSEPKRIFTVAGWRIPDSSEVFVLPDDSLLHMQGVSNLSDVVFPEGAPRIPMTISARRSVDDGETWSDPVLISTRTKAFPRDQEDPEGEEIAGAHLFDAAVAADGTAYVVWSDIDSSPQRVALSKSTDGGATWSQPSPVVEGTGPFLLATAAVGHRGTVGVSFYDFRNHVPDGDSDDELTTDAWFRYSTDRGDTWTERHLVGPFDMRQAPITVGYFLGDYAGLDAAASPDAHGPETFASALAVAPPVAEAGASDIWFSSVRLLPPAAADGGGRGDEKQRPARAI